LQKYQHDSEMQFKYFAEILGVEVEEAKLVSGATIDIAKARREANEQAGNENGSDQPGGEQIVSTASGETPE